MTNKNLSKLLKSNPSLSQAADVAQICAPLEKMGIVYFSHAHIDEKNGMAGICNHPEFFKLYFEKGYYQYDLHKSDQPLGEQVVLWDLFDRNNESADLNDDFTSFNQDHNFSICYNHGDTREYFHFAGRPDDHRINQFYLSNIDLLKKFINHFQDKVKRNKSLNDAYDLRVKLDMNIDGYFNHAIPELSEENEEKLNFSRIYHQASNAYITIREFACLKSIANGRTIAETAKQLNISERTVKEHIVNMKQKLSCHNLFQLGMVYQELKGIAD